MRVFEHRKLSGRHLNCKSAISAATSRQLISQIQHLITTGLTDNLSIRKIENNQIQNKRIRFDDLLI